MYRQNIVSRQQSLTIMALFLALLTTAGFGQIPKQNDLSAAQRAQLLQFAQTQGEKWQAERAAAEVLARQLNLPIRQTFPDGRVIELQRFENGMPIYYTTCNLISARTISTDRVWPSGGAGLLLTGAGQTLGIWDEARVLVAHQEFGGRVTLSDGATALSQHATHVAGTMIASGVVPQAQGMASGAQLQAYDWNNDVAEMATAAANGIRVSNHSYVQLTGWEWNLRNDNLWYWAGNRTINAAEDYLFGFYGAITQSMDNLARNAPFYLIVRAAGNDRAHTGTTGDHFDMVNGVWQWRTGHTHNPDGSPNGYDTVHDGGIAKNVLTVGAVDDIPGGYTNSAQVVQINANYSSWGPTDDGRIKPDIVANGENLVSADSLSNTAYVTLRGTSMAAPSVSGSIGLLWQHLRNLYGANVNLLSSTMKALLIHTADEAGPNPGPDYQFGWGLMNTQTAAQVMTMDANANGGLHIRELTLNQSPIYIDINSDGSQPLRATICWTDPAGTPVAPQLDPNTRMLVNDLDLRIDRFDGQNNRAWALIPATPAAAAFQGDNSIDNVEQVLIAAPLPGAYTLVIEYKGVLQGGSQQFSLILTGQKPTVSINDVIETEGNSGAVNVVFTVSLSERTSQTVIVDYDTEDFTALAGSDYDYTFGSLVFTPGMTSKTFSVPVIVDLVPEPDESFFVSLSNLTNAIMADNYANGYILNDDVASNDDCNQPTIITSLPFTNSINTTSMTSVLSDPEFGCSDGARGKTVWYSFTPSAAAYVSINTFGSNYDTDLGLFTGACGALTEVACNGDAQGGLQSEIIYQLQAGVAYLMLVGDFYNPGTGGNLVFNLQAIPPPTISSFNPTSGAAGTTLTILGSSFNGATQVAFNGVAASFTINSDTLISAVVPTGATTGKITVTTPSGTGTSATNFTVSGPAFTDIGAALIGVYSTNSCAWGDYDSDGDLDILLAGFIDAGFNFVSKVYRNDGGNFVDIAAPIAAAYYSAVAWGDYDNDGDLDILLAGHPFGSAIPIAKIYRNDAGNFVDIAAALTGVYSSNVAWGDYDNDGDLDILLTGVADPPGNYISKIYRNDAGSFVDIAAPLSPAYGGSAAWGDYDTDGDLDILLTGNSTGSVSPFTKIYRNDAGAFVDINAALTAVQASSVAWGDYDSDGDLDILLTGNASLTATPVLIAKIFRNDAGAFIDLNAALTPVQASAVAWGDYDNDGDLDILLNGNTGSGKIAKVYRNDAGIFVDIAAPLAGVSSGSAAWGDYDNDADLDILLAGDTGSGIISKVYRNNITTPKNTAPTAPTNLSATVSGSSVTFSWTKATDGQTPQNGLTYNLRLGTTAGGMQKVSPMANVSTGDRRVPKLGNTNHRASWTIKNLPTGTFFWSAQAIDHAFAGSAFANELSFTIGGGPCTNIALNKTATASNSKSSNTPNKAVDGSTSTYWRSSSGGTQWWQVDLSTGTLSYSQFTIKWKSSRHAKDYEIRVSTTSSFTTFTTVYTKTGGSGGTETITLTGAPRTERYVRLHMTKVNSSYYGVNEFEVCGFSSVTIAKQSGDADEETVAVIPTEMALHQNYPNPFNPSTTIRFDLPEAARVTLKVFNLLGQEAATLVEGLQPAGTHEVVFNATNLPSGTYFYVMQAGEVRQVRRLTLMK